MDFFSRLGLLAWLRRSPGKKGQNLNNQSFALNLISEVGNNGK